MRQQSLYIYIWRKREIYFRELAHVIVGTGKSKIRRPGQQTGDAGKSSYCSMSPFFLGDLGLFFLRPSID